MKERTAFCFIKRQREYIGLENSCANKNKSAKGTVAALDMQIQSIVSQFGWLITRKDEITRNKRQEKRILSHKQSSICSVFFRFYWYN